MTSWSRKILLCGSFARNGLFSGIDNYLERSKGSILISNEEGVAVLNLTFKHLSRGVRYPQAEQIPHMADSRGHLGG